MSANGAAILVVDDRNEDLLVLRSVLAADRREVVTARSGPEALRYLLEREFAVIVLDVVMPGMDGFELAGLIRDRERSSQTPILFLTGIEDGMAAIYRAYSLGAVDYLTKPVDPDVLRVKVAVFVALFEKDRRILEQRDALLEAERRNRELELAQIKLVNDRRYRNLADAVPHIVWTADARGTVEYFNRRWTEYTGRRAEDAEGSWIDAVHPDERAECEERWCEAIEAGRLYEVECRLRDGRGAYRWHLCRALPERNGEDEIVGWLGTHTDLHDMFLARERAESALRARDEFMSIASHELRTPLSALMVQLGSLERTLPETSSEAGAKAARKLAAALRHTNRLAKLVDTLLDVSRLASNRLEMQLEEHDLADVIRDVTERFQDEARLAGCDLAVSVDGVAVGRWDRTRIEQVVTNLISNAIKYGRGAPIDIALETNETSARVTVRDRGIGIPVPDQARIFERFERAAPVQHYGGLGLGLYIARKIVEAHDGTIEVASRAGEGATFAFTLPRGLEGPE